MPPKRLAADFGYFACDARELAEKLIGAELFHRGKVARIVETEAYRGPGDAACHAHKGLTSRTRPLFGPPATVYVFLVYGMHECFNIVCMGEGAGHAVLIRAGEPLRGLQAEARLGGPGLFGKAMGFSREDNGRSVCSQELFVLPSLEPPRIARTPRVGVAYAGEVAKELWRFLDADSAHVSRPSRSTIGLGRTSR